MPPPPDRSLPNRLRASFLGPSDSYSNVAAQAYFGSDASLEPVATIGIVFDSVRRGACDFGIVPIENSTDGRVVDTVGRLLDDNVTITGEISVAIHHYLLSFSEPAAIREVHSKPQAISQCREWLSRHMPGAALVETASTAAAAESASSRKDIAAIASFQAATRFKLPVVADCIEDNPDNVTRFAVLGTKPTAATGDDKTTLTFEVNHEPGALADVMMIFKRHRLNLTWIESFPQPGKRNEYFFVIEFRGHRDDRDVAQALRELHASTRHTHVLGSYPVGQLV